MPVEYLPRNAVSIGDVRELAARLEPQSIQCIVCSPPYFGLRSYLAADHPDKDKELGSEATPAEFVANLVAVFAALRPALKDDGCLWLNLGDSYNSGTQHNHGRSTALNEGRGRYTEATTEKWGGHRALLSDYPPKCLLGMPWRVAFALIDDGWILRSDVIWCLSGGTRVYARTQKGEVPSTIKDLARLDPATVQLWNGEKWTQVLGWNRSADTGDPIELELRSGERIGCTPEHQWPTQRGIVRTADLRVGDVLYATRLPEPETARQPSGLDDEMIGWFCGLYLAEGHMGEKSILISGHTKEVERYRRCQEIARAFHGSCTWREHGGHSASITVSGKILRAIIDTYIAGDGAGGKHLTNACWQRSDTFLRALLDGYLHGDGHYDAKNDRWRLGFTRNYAWEADLRTLCARLGVSLRLKLMNATLDGREYPAHRGQLRFNPSTHFNVRADTEIMRIGRSKGRQFWDIGVADEPHLFALGSGVLTHNSKPNPMPESVTDRPTRAHEYVFLLTKRPNYFYDQEAIRERHSDPHVVNGVYTRRASGKNRHDFIADPKDGMARPDFDHRHRDYNPAGRNKRSVWTIASAQFPDAHYATFPPDLVRPCVLAGTSEYGECAGKVTKLRLRPDLTEAELAKVLPFLRRKGIA